MALEKLKGEHTLFKGHYWTSGKGFHYIKKFDKPKGFNGYIELSKIKYGLSKPDNWVYILGYRMHKWGGGKWSDYEITENEFKNNLIDWDKIKDIPKYTTALMIGVGING